MTGSGRMLSSIAEPGAPAKLVELDELWADCDLQSLLGVQDPHMQVGGARGNHRDGDLLACEMN